VTDVANGQARDGAGLSAADEQVLQELTERARAGGLKLTGEGGLLGKLTKMVIEGALEGELDDHLGYGKKTRQAVMAAIPAMATAPRPCSPIPGRWRSPCRAIVIPVSSRESSPRGSGG
jgi:hypothetical protein